MDELTAAAGLTRGALYHHFGDKQDCWLRWPPNSTRKWTRGCSASRTRRPTPGRRCANAAAPGCAWRPNPKSSASRWTRAPCWGRPREPAQQPCITSLATLLQSLMDEGQVRAAEPQALARLINGALMDGAFWIAAAPDDGERLEQALRALDLLLDGCAKAPRQAPDTKMHGAAGVAPCMPGPEKPHAATALAGSAPLLLFKDNSCLNTHKPAAAGAHREFRHRAGVRRQLGRPAAWRQRAAFHRAGRRRRPARHQRHIATTILPSIIKDIGGLEYYAWNTTLFVVTSIVGSAPIGAADPGMGSQGGVPAGRGRLLGRLGRLCARALHALDAGGPQHPGTGRRRAVRAELCADPHRVRRGAVVARDGAGVRHVATLCGPAIGGIFAQTGHWRLAFWTLLPAGALLAFIVATKVGGKSTVSDARPAGTAGHARTAGGQRAGHHAPACLRTCAGTWPASSPAWPSRC